MVVQKEPILYEKRDTLILAVTKDCNLACSHCHTEAGKALENELATSEIEKLISDFAHLEPANERFHLGLTGGEPFLRPDIIEIANFASRLRYTILINSNGTLITEEHAEELSEIKNLTISISLDGPNEEIHSLIRGNGNFYKTLSTIQKLIDKGITIRANMAVTQKNIWSLEETLDMAYNMGVNEFNCFPMIKMGRAIKGSKSKILHVSKALLNRKLFEILRKNPKYKDLLKKSRFAYQFGAVSSLEQYTNCGIGTERRFYIQSDGSVYPCATTVAEDFYLGNVREESLQTIWDNSPVLSKLRAQSVEDDENCKACDTRYICIGGCLGENNQYRGRAANCDEHHEVIEDMKRIAEQEPGMFPEIKGVRVPCFTEMLHL